MIVSTINQQGLNLKEDQSIIAYQYSENLQIKVNYDGTYNGYAIKWDAMGSNKRKRIPLEYDTKTQCITLNKECFVDDYLYIACAFIKEGVVINTNPVEYYIPESVNHGLDTVPQVSGLYEEMRKLFEQIYANEYKQPLQDLVNNATDRINALLQKATTDYVQLKSDTDSVLDKLKSDYIKAINDLSVQYDKDKIAMLDELTRQIQELKDTTTTAIDTMIKNANTDYNNLKQSTKADVDTLKSDAQQSIKSMDDLQADLINKRDNGFFDGDDGALIPSNGFFTLFKREGHLLIRYLKGSSPPPLFIKNGHLIYRKVKEV